VNDQPVHRDDITALRREGDLKAYMQQLRAEGRARLNTPPPTRPSHKRRKWGAIPIPPDHKPGQWPPGTSPPGPAPERQRDPEDWADAVHRYRAEQRRTLTEREAP
jgi:hypothetical protein